MGTIIGLTFTSGYSCSCPYCGRAYKSTSALEKHIGDKHPEAVGSEKTPEGDVSMSGEE